MLLNQKAASRVFNFPYISQYFSRELFLVAVHGWFAIQTNVWNCKTQLDAFSEHSYIPQLLSVKSFA